MIKLAGFSSRADALLLSAMIVCMLGVSSLEAQEPEPASAESTTTAPETLEPTTPFDIKDLDLELALPKPEVIMYSPNNRRNPFKSLIEGVLESEVATSGKKEFMNISDLTLKGILQISSAYVAIFVGVNGKTYLLKEGEKVYDGELIKIERNKVVFEKPEYTLFGTVKKKEIIDIPLHM